MDTFTRYAVAAAKFDGLPIDVKVALKQLIHDRQLGGEDIRFSRVAGVSVKTTGTNAEAAVTSMLDAQRGPIAEFITKHSAPIGNAECVSQRLLLAYELLRGAGVNVDGD